MDKFSICFAQDDRVLISEEPFRRIQVVASCKEENTCLEYLLATDFSVDDEGSYRIYALVAQGNEVRNIRNEEEYQIILEMMAAFEKFRAETRAVIFSGERGVQ